jgi:hypothetical protein
LVPPATRSRRQRRKAADHAGTVAGVRDAIPSRLSAATEALQRAIRGSG